MGTNKKIIELHEKKPKLTRKQIAEKLNISERTVYYALADRQFTAVIYADIHCPYQDKQAVEIAIDYGMQVKPDMVIMLGDFADFYKVSHWRNDPMRQKFFQEIEASKRLLSVFTDSFKDCEKIFVKGNHEKRLDNYLDSRAPELKGVKGLTVPGLLCLEEMGWQYFDCWAALNDMGQTYKIGSLHLLHGHEVKISAAAVNLARLLYYKTLVNVLGAHYHTTQEYLFKKLDHSHEGGWIIGCLCKLSPEYRPIVNWNHGFAIVSWFPCGDFSVENKKIINGKVL
jgi:predicted phosphodiesterase